MHHVLTSFSYVFCCFRLILVQHGTWHRSLWNEIEISQLLDGVDKQRQMLAGLPEKIVQDWDLYRYLTHTAGTVRISLPIVEGLNRLVSFC